MDDIMVTAQKREEKSQDVPIAVVALDASDLQARGVSDVAALETAVPGLQLPQLSGLVMPFLRGVGAATVAIGNEPSVAVYIDGVYSPRLPPGLLNLANVTRVEVLKGPQSTLFGRNSTAGVINIVTADPSHDPFFKASLGYGRFQAYQGSAFLGTGLGERAAVDVSIFGKTDDGFGHVLSTGGRYGYQDQFSIRPRFLFEPSADTRILLNGFYSWSRGDGNKAPWPGTSIRAALSEPHTIYTSDDVGYYNSLKTETDRFRIWSASLRIDQNLAIGRISSISSYTSSRESTVYPFDQNGRDDYVGYFSGTNRIFTQEIQFSNHGSGKESVTGGIFYYNSYGNYDKLDFVSPILFGPAFGAPGFGVPARQRSSSLAAFAQARYEPLPGLGLTGGIRYTWDWLVAAGGQTVLMTNPPIPLPGGPLRGEDRRRRMTFKASIDYHPSRSILFYASFNRGHKAGAFNILTYSSNVPTDPETIDAFELGVKGDFFERRVRLNAAAFLYDLKSPQVQIDQNNLLRYSNAGAARINGAELEGRVAALDGLDLRFGLQFLDAKYSTYFNAPANAADFVNGGTMILAPIDAAGHHIPYSPKFTFSAGGDYSLKIGGDLLTVTVDFYHNSGFDFEPDNNLHQQAYDLVSAQLGYMPSQQVAVRLWGKNLTGSRYASWAGASSPQAFLYRPGSPTTFGLTTDFSF